MQPNLREDTIRDSVLPYEVPVCSLRAYKRRISDETREIDVAQRSNVPAPSHYEFDPGYLETQSQDVGLPGSTEYHHLNAPTDVLVAIELLIFLNVSY